MNPLAILAISPHLGNAEISVGGTITISIRQNRHVGVLELAQADFGRGTARWSMYRAWQR